jgi:hypothetical protein
MQMSGRHAVFFGLRCALASVREFFSGQQLLRAHNFFYFFFLCPVASPLQRHHRFIYFFPLSGRFNSAGEPTISFLFAQSLPVNSSCAHRFFLTGHSHILLPCAQPFVFVSGLICADTLF